MRILHLVHQYMPEKIGGTELYTRSVARQQARLGHAVRVVTPAVSAEEVFSREDEVGVYRLSVKSRSPLQIFAATFRTDPRFLALWREVLEVERPDIVHIQHLMGIGPGAVEPVQRAGIPIVVTLHDYWTICANAQLYTNYDETICAGPDARFINCGRCSLARAGLPSPPWLAGPLGPLLARRRRRLAPILAGAAAVIAPSAFVAGIYQTLFPEGGNPEILPHGLDLPEIPDRTKPTAGSGPGNSAPELSLVYIGGIAPQKGVATLIEGFNGLPPGAALDIYGDLTAHPDYVAHLRRLIRHPGISLRGALAHEAIWPVLAAADAAAVPTLWYETFSLIVDEAFAAGTPVIASDLGVLRDKIQPGENGLLLPAGDPAAWHDALRRLADDRRPLADWRRRIPTPMTIEVHTERLLQVYQRSIGKS